MHTFENPFAGYGHIVSRNHFIGRKTEISAIERRVFSSHPGSLALIGMPRIGKSSLAYHMTIERFQMLREKRFLPIWINLATYKCASEFFHALVMECVIKIKRYTDWFNADLQEALNVYQREQTVSMEGFEAIKRFFEQIKINNIHVIFVLDEFDHARNLFKDDPAGFQRLRELAYHPDHRVTYITTSRRSIRQIETQSNSISTFFGIFKPLYIDQFEEEDLQEYFSRLIEVGMPISDSLKEKMKDYTGGHPYLLAMLGYELVECFCEGKRIDIDSAVRQASISFRPYYDQIITLLREDGNLIKLLQILFGSTIDVSPDDIDEFLKYGFIQEGSESRYIAFSPHFQSYLTIVDRNSEMGQENNADLWSVWRETEKALRAVMAQVLQGVYGNQWFDRLEQAHPKLSLRNGKNVFQRCRSDQEKEMRNWGNRASKNLLDFTYPKELFDIILKEWNAASFKDVFGKDKSYWEQRAQLLSKIRNPLAHNRDEVLSDSERMIAEGYCKEILEILQKAKEVLSAKPTSD